MIAEELKNTSLYKTLEADKQFQTVIEKLGATIEWGKLIVFVGTLKQQMLEDMLSCERIEDIQRYKNQILGMERLVALPGAVKLIREAKREDEESKENDRREQERMKFNPGVIGRTIYRKVTRKGSDT